MIAENGRKIAAVIAVALAASVWWQFGPRSPAAWTDSDIFILQSLSLDNLPALPADPSNAVADNLLAAEFGHKLFFDTRLSANGAVSCATCHQPTRHFSDSFQKGRGIGLSGRNTRSIVGSAYSPWQYWDGRRDSQWAQALSPLEDPAEHGGNRMQFARFISVEPGYRANYQALFGELPDFSDRGRFPEAAAPLDDYGLSTAWNSMTREDQHKVNKVFANIGKVLAAYERLLLPGPSRFDQYVNAVVNSEQRNADALLTDDEIIGLQLFIGKARCTECHNGPLFTNNEFHNTGVLSFPGELPDRGRTDGLKKVLADPFNCNGNYSDDESRRCDELTYVRSGIELLGAMRTPSLRNLGGTAPYSHKGQQATLADVIDLYNRAPLAMIGHNEAEDRLYLSRRERKQLAAFLNSLEAPLATAEKWLKLP
ncbi:MAG: cytochrome-c peroxidase [Woeseiaceae bacterium]